MNIILLGSFKFPDKCFGFRLVLGNEFTKIVPSAFGSFIGHHQGLFASVRIFFLSFFITLQKLRKRNPNFEKRY